MSYTAFWVGVIPVGIFLLIKLGIVKSWFILETLPGLLSARMFYAALPVGLGFVFASFLPALPNYDPNANLYFSLLVIAFLGGPMIGFLFMYRPPNWLDPKWLQWLKEEYGYCLPLLIENAQQLNRWDWEWQVRTQAGMQSWIDSVYKQHKEDIDFAWQIEKKNRVSWQNQKKGLFSIRAGMKIEGYIPIHRQGDDVLIKEELDAVIAYQNEKFLKTHKPMEF